MEALHHNHHDVIDFLLRFRFILDLDISNDRDLQQRDALFYVTEHEDTIAAEKLFKAGAEV